MPVLIENQFPIARLPAKQSDRFIANLGLDPRSLDTDGDGLADGEEDADRDAASNLLEQERGLDPLHADTDRDGWFDNDEVLAGSDPLRSASVPSFRRVSLPVALLNTAREPRPGDLLLQRFSRPSTYLNTAPEPKPGPTEAPRFSPGVSFRNE